MPLETRDLLEIQMLLAHYGHVIDDRDWDAFDTVFTEDVVYDATDFGIGVMHGIPAIIDSWGDPFSHPLGHHTTNVVISEDEDGTVRTRAKHIGPRTSGITLVTYDDIVRKTDQGWRIARRTATLRGRIPIPEGD
jgi:3-phenylpropionate/cinnamic acid dioxygenase small subunit